MKVEFEFSFGNLSNDGYRHFPVLYLCNGSDGFILCIIGVHMIVTWGKAAKTKQNKKHEIMIDGGVIADVDHEVFTDKFLEWIESNGWSFGGSIGPDDSSNSMLDKDKGIWHR